MQQFSFNTSALLAFAGMGLSTMGIAAGEFKPVAIGLVLLLGAGVFARLFRGTRKIQNTADSHNRQI